MAWSLSAYGQRATTNTAQGNRTGGTGNSGQGGGNTDSRGQGIASVQLHQRQPHYNSLATERRPPSASMNISMNTWRLLMNLSRTSKTVLLRSLISSMTVGLVATTQSST
jgi:hypothetical protein